MKIVIIQSKRGVESSKNSSIINFHNYHRTIIIRTSKNHLPFQNSNSKLYQLRIKLMIKALIKISSTTITIFCGGFIEEKKSDSSFRKSRGGGKIFSPFRRLSPVRRQAQRRGSPRDSFKGITPLAFPRQPRRRDWHSRRVLDPFVDRRDTSTRHWTASIRPTNGGQRPAPRLFQTLRANTLARNILLQSLDILFIIIIIII